MAVDNAGLLLRAFRRRTSSAAMVLVEAQLHQAPQPKFEVRCNVLKKRRKAAATHPYLRLPPAVLHRNHRRGPGDHGLHRR